MKIMMLPCSANSFKGTAQKLFMKARCYSFNKDLPQESTCRKSPRKKWFVSVSFPIFFFFSSWVSLPFLTSLYFFLIFSAPALNLSCTKTGLLNHSLFQLVLHMLAYAQGAMQLLGNFIDHMKRWASHWVRNFDFTIYIYILHYLGSGMESPSMVTERGREPVQG